MSKQLLCQHLRDLLIEAWKVLNVLAPNEPVTGAIFIALTKDMTDLVTPPEEEDDNA